MAEQKNQKSKKQPKQKASKQSKNSEKKTESSEKKPKKSSTKKNSSTNEQAAKKDRSAKKDQPAKKDEKLTKKKKVKLLYRPALIGTVGFLMQFIISIAAYYENILKVPYDQVFWFIGVILIFGGFLITYLYQSEQEKLKNDVLDTIYPGEVSSLLTGGVYAVVRHPGYLGAIMMQFGMAFASRSYLPMIFAGLMTTFWVLVALKEERLLEIKFGEEYEEYRDVVKWRFIPGIF
jgi:protein-S-isoprenylcysteine O-methyltransferase Ste14